MEAPARTQQEEAAFAIYCEWIRHGVGSIIPQDTKADPTDPREKPNWDLANTEHARRNACERRWANASQATKQEFLAMAQAAERILVAA